MDHQAFAQLLGNYGEFFGAFAVVVTLIYLAVQIRQNTRATMAESRYSAGQTNTEVCLAIATDPEFSDIWRRGLADLSTLSVEERFRWNYFAYASWDSWEIAHTQWRRRMLSDGDWVKYQRIIEMQMAAPGIREYWSETKEAYHPEFRKLVEGVEPKPLDLTTFPEHSST